MKPVDRVVMITGASHGIGRAAALRFARAGSRLVLVARSTARLEQVSAEAAPAETLVVTADVGETQAAPRIVDAAVGRFGRIDVLVNNAGIGLGGPAQAVSPSDVQTVLAVNFLGPLRLMQHAIPAMREGGGGLVVTISSILGRRSTPWNGVYCASKAALERLVESLRVEHAPDHIRFSTLYPGVTQTAFVEHSLGSTSGRRAGLRGVSPERVAERLVRVVEREPRDAYVTLFDWTFVQGSRLFPRFADRVLGRYFAGRAAGGAPPAGRH